MQSEQTDFHKKLLQVLESQDGLVLNEELAEARAADIAESFELLDDERRSQILFSLPPRVAAEVVVLLDEAVRGEIVDDMDARSISELVSELPPDDAADVLGELEDEEVSEVLGHLEGAESKNLEKLLAYEDSTAGSIMTTNVIAVPASATVGDAIEQIRAATWDEELHEVYVVDTVGKLIGYVSLRLFVVHAPSTKIADICETDVVSVEATDDQEAVIQIIRKYDVLEAAVVDKQGRLLGRITHDDLMDVAEEEAEEDLLRMAGTDAAEFETTSVIHAARIRLTWLLPCMLGSFVSASVLLSTQQKFPDPVTAMALLAFAPMIGAMGGNSGIQISTVIIRGFATGELASSKLLRALAREGRIALLMAPVCGLTAWLLATISQPVLHDLGLFKGTLANPHKFAMSVGTAMVLAILIAAFLGIALPFLFKRIGVDPAIASGPLVTTLNDVVSVSTYMLFALMLMG